MKKGVVLPWFSLANLALLCLVFAIGTWVAEDYPFSTFIAYAPPAPWMVLSLVLVLCSLHKRNRTWLKLNGAVLLIFGWVLLGIKVPFRADRSGSEGSFTLMTFNMMGGQGGFDQVLQIVRENNPDIICLQEARGLGDGSNVVPGYQVAARSDLAVLSKEPSIRSEYVELFPGSPGALEVEFASGLKVVATHLAFHSFETVGRKGVPVHMQTVAKKHEVEVDMLVNRYAGRPKVIIAGDFNLPPRGKVYSKLRDHFADAFASAGWLTGYTWPSNFPVQRIDYAFTTDVKVQSARTISSTVSNHLPVLFRFKL